MRLHYIFFLVFIWTSQAFATTLIPENSISADYITLGDIFEGDFAGADKIVARAPAPGRHAVYDATSLYRLARMNNIDWQPASPQILCIITRASTVIDAAQITTTLAAAFDEKRDISIDYRGLEIHLPAEQAPFLAIAQLDVDPLTHRFRASLIAGEQQPIQVSGKAVPLVTIPVLTQNIEKDHIITAADVEIVELPLDRYRGALIDEHDDLIGMAATRRLQSHTPLRPRDVSPPLEVKKGDVVTVVLSRGNLRLTAKAKALKSGANGESIMVVNTMSSRTIEATILGPNLVSVEN